MWSYRLAVLSFVMTVFFAGCSFIEPWVLADNIAEALAPRTGIAVAVLRQHLQDILTACRFWHGFVYCSPWAFLTLVFSARAIADFKRRQTEARGH